MPELSLPSAVIDPPSTRMPMLPSPVKLNARMPATLSPVATTVESRTSMAMSPVPLVALAAANAHGTVALDLDVYVARGYGDVALSVMDEGHSAGIRAFRHDIGAADIDMNVAFFTPVPAPDAIEISPSVLVVVHAVDAVDAGDVDVDVPDIEGEVTAFSSRIEKGNTVCGAGVRGLDIDGAVPHDDAGLAATQMIAEDSVDQTFAADLYIDIPDIDRDVSGAAMATEYAGGPTGIDCDVGVPHSDTQVSLAALESNDAGPPSVHIDDNVADDEIVVAAELLACVISVAPIAVDGVRALPFARDREEAARDFRTQRARPPVMGDRNSSSVRGHVGGSEERDVACMVRIGLDPHGAVERGSTYGKNQLVVVGGRGGS